MMLFEFSELDAQLIQAHKHQDLAMLSKLYSQAGSLMEASNDMDAACFFWTQAYVLALDQGLEESEALQVKLAAHGRL